MRQMEFENEIEVKAKVKFNHSPGYPATQEDPGCPEDFEDIEISCAFEDQSIYVQEYILEQCAEAVLDARDYADECRAEARLDRLNGAE